MDQRADLYRIRLARPDEVWRLREIEDEAGAMFWTPGMRAIREKETQHGLRVDARVFMCRSLDRAGRAG